MSIRIGADVGGTFTDIVIEVADGSYSSTKVLTTHDAPEVGILDGIGRIAAQENIDLRDVTQIIHGTTLATNALIERRGAKTCARHDRRVPRCDRDPHREPVRAVRPQHRAADPRSSSGPIATSSANG
jgi:hypothetical protein